MKSTGGAGSNLTFPDTDYPMYRLADAYLIYAEAVLRGGGGSRATALGYVNALRSAPRQAPSPMRSSRFRSSSTSAVVSCSGRGCVARI